MDPVTIQSVKQSYYNILAFFLEGEKMESRYVKCLIKWGLQLKLSQVDIDAAEKIEGLQFSQPTDKVARLEAIYHLVEMIYIDNVVEDVELEVASIYAEKLGFKRQVVGDLFKSIATRDTDGASGLDIRKEVVDFLKLNGY